MESPIPLIIERLKTVFELNKVSGMVTLEAMLQQSLPSPSCFVYHTNDVLDDKYLMDRIGGLDKALGIKQSLTNLTQVIESYYAVAVVYKNFKINDETNPSYADDLNQKIIELLTGWKPFGEYPLIYKGSSPLFEQNRLIRENIFSLTQILNVEYR
jgi:hypothetical protein